MGKFRYSEIANEKIKKKFGNYLSGEEEMLIYTTVSGAYLRQKFMLHFALVSLITIPLFYFIYWILRFDLPTMMGLALFLALLYALQRFYFTKEGIQYILTDRRVIVQIGYFNVTLYSANYNKITHIEVEQSFVDRMFYKHGKLTIRTAGMDEKPITLDFVESPIEFKNTMERLISQERRRYGHMST